MNRVTGQDLKKLRERLRLTQDEMAKHMGVAREWLSKLENGKQPISGDVTLRYFTLLREFGFTGVVMDTDDDIRDPYPVGRHQGPAPTQPDPDDPILKPGVKPPPGGDADPVKPAETEALRAEWTKEDCMRYLETYLRRAEVIPGAVGRAYLQLKLHLPLWELDRLDSSRSMQEFDQLLRAADDAARAAQAKTQTGKRQDHRQGA